MPLPVSHKQPVQYQNKDQHRLHPEPWLSPDSAFTQHQQRDPGKYDRYSASPDKCSISGHQRDQTKNTTIARPGKLPENPKGQIVYHRCPGHDYDPCNMQGEQKTQYKIHFHINTIWQFITQINTIRKQ
jgi:hypothetical protein